jgi:hypothetical protein
LQTNSLPTKTATSVHELKGQVAVALCLLREGIVLGFWTDRVFHNGNLWSFRCPILSLDLMESAVVQSNLYRFANNIKLDRAAFDMSAGRESHVHGIKGRSGFILTASITFISLRP